MKQLYIYIFSTVTLIVWIGCHAVAQDQPDLEADSIEYQGDEIKTDSLTNLQGDTTKIVTDTTELSGDTIQSGANSRIEFYIDYLKLLTFVLPNELKGEVGLAFITRPNLGIHSEFGYGKKNPEDHFRNAEYSVEGIYARLGLQYHYPYDPSTNLIIGAMYGYSSYGDEANYTVESSLWDDYTDTLLRENLQGQWVEIIAGSEASFKGSLYLGFQFRFRVLIRQDNFSPFEVFAIPGYGRTTDKTVPALNLYVKYMIDFKR